MKQRQIRPELVAYFLENSWQMSQVGARVPVFLRGKIAAACGFVVVTFTGGLRLRGDTVEGADTGYRSLDAYCGVAQLAMVADGIEQFEQVPSRGVSIRAQTRSGRATEQLVHRKVRDLTVRWARGAGGNNTPTRTR
jgi:hypothetical protein